MGRIREPELRALAEKWSPIVMGLLDQVGRKLWRPKKERSGLLDKPHVVLRHLLEGPAQRGDSIIWALSHTRVPSTFDDSGALTEGEREFWLVTLQSGALPTFRVAGAEVIENIPAEEKALERALEQARRQGPKVESFYGNKGPISQK